MQFGVHLPQLGHGADRANLARFARRAEELGYHSGWVSDHIAWPAAFESKYPYSDNGDFPAPNNMPWLDPIGSGSSSQARSGSIRDSQRRVMASSTATSTSPDSTAAASEAP